MVHRHQANPATQEVSAPFIAERNSDVPPPVTNKVYRDFTLLSIALHTKKIRVQNSAPSPQTKSQMG